MRKVLRHRVRYHEADAQGYLFNSRYLEIADVAMTEYFRALGFPYRELVAVGADPSVVTAQVHFRRPARFEDEIDVFVACPRVGTSSFDLDFELHNAEGETVARIANTYVNVDAESATARPLPEAVAAALDAELPSAAPSEE